MISKQWTLQQCELEAKRYKTRNDFVQNSNAAYHAAYRNGWLDDICKHMENPKYITWNKNTIIAIAKKYNSRREFRQKEPKAYNAASRYKWLKELNFGIHKENNYGTVR